MLAPTIDLCDKLVFKKISPALMTSQRRGDPLKREVGMKKKALIYVYIIHCKV